MSSNNSINFVIYSFVELFKRIIFDSQSNGLNIHITQFGIELFSNIRCWDYLKRIRYEQKETENTRKSNEVIYDQDKQYSRITIQCDFNIKKKKYSAKECTFLALTLSKNLQCKLFCT